MAVGVGAEDMDGEAEGDAAALREAETVEDTVPEREGETEVVSEGEPEAEREPVGETVPVPETVPEALAAAETETEGDVEGEVEVVGEAEPIAEADAESEAAGDAEGAVEVEGEPELELVAAGEAEAAEERETEAEGDPEKEPVGEAVPEPEAAGEALAAAEAEIEGDVEPEREPVGEAEDEPVARGEAEPAAEPEGEGEVVGEDEGDLICRLDCLIVILNALALSGQSISPAAQDDWQPGSDDTEHNEVEPPPFNLWRVCRTSQPRHKRHKQLLPPTIWQAIIQRNSVGRQHPRKTRRAVIRTRNGIVFKASRHNGRLVDARSAVRPRELVRARK